MFSAYGKKIFIIATIFLVLVSFFSIFRSHIQNPLGAFLFTNEPSHNDLDGGRIIKMRALKNQWTFYPESIKVKKDEHITLKIYNEDDYEHGFTIGPLEINTLLLPEEETVIKFVATQTGSFGFYCSIPCGEGHYRMKGEALIR